MMMGGGRPVRLYESMLANVRYVYGRPIPFPLRKQFETEAELTTERKRHWAAREGVEADEWLRVQRRREPADG